MLLIPPGQLRESYVAAAATLKDKANHYMLAPTVLSFMGYDSKDIETTYKSSLLNPDKGFIPMFTTGDIFGMFSNEVKWNPIDVNQDMLEAPAKAIFNRSTASAQNEAAVQTTN